MGYSIATQLDVVTTGTQEAVTRLNGVAIASERIKSSRMPDMIGFGGAAPKATQEIYGLERAMGRLAGGNRELFMLFRGLQAGMNATGDASARLQATLVGGGVLLTIIAAWKALNHEAEVGKKYFEDAGEGAHSFFDELNRGMAGDLADAMGISVLNAKLEDTEKHFKNLERGFRDFKTGISRDERDAGKPTSAVDTIKDQQHDIETHRGDQLGGFKDRIAELKEQIKGVQHGFFGGDNWDVTAKLKAQIKVYEDLANKADANAQKKLADLSGQLPEAAFQDRMKQARDSDAREQYRKEGDDYLKKLALPQEEAERMQHNLAKGGRRFEGGLSELGSVEANKALNYTKMGRETSDIPIKQLDEMKRLGVTMKDVLMALRNMPASKLN